MALALCAGAMALSCSSSKPQRSIDNTVGQISLALTLPSGAKLNSVDWKITSTSTPFTAQGTIKHERPERHAVGRHPLSASTGDVVTLTGTTTTGSHARAPARPSAWWPTNR